MRRLQFALVLALVALMSVALPAAAGSPPATRDAKASTKVFEKSSAIVVFKSLPLATYDGRIKGYEKTRPAGGKHVNANSAAAKKYLGYLKTQHSAYATWLRANAPGAKITSNLYVTLNAVGVKLNGNALSKLKANTAVSVVEYTTLYQQTMSESHKIINADAAWSAAGGRSDAGRGIKIGMIDSGIDETHPFFDPSGFSYPAGFPKCDARNGHPRSERSLLSSSRVQLQQRKAKRASPSIISLSDTYARLCSSFTASGLSKVPLRTD